MNKLTCVLALAAAMALAAPQAVLAKTVGAGHKSVSTRPANKKIVRKSSMQAKPVANKTAKKMATRTPKKISKKRIVSHRKSQKAGAVSKAA